LEQKHRTEMDAELNAKEAMRKEKDQTIRELHEQIERQRDSYERRINELDQIIKSKSPVRSFKCPNTKNLEGERVSSLDMRRGGEWQSSSPILFQLKWKSQ
jgi:ferritin-like metal-binding protein YciE